ncbi:DEAD/DEAH box helicase, partial [Candidatus Parvarchaeota archaeon]|nr:DEAD/DEAH box helicase [Candidatus Parvarchaeota archaeon]
MPQTVLSSYPSEVLPEGKSVVIYADSREPEEFDSLLGGLGAHVVRKQLEVGDFIVSQRCCIERKTRQDFESSIIDGRIFSQAQNLCGAFQRPVLIVEGTQKPDGGISMQAILGAYACLVCDYGLSVFFVKSQQALAQLLFSFARYEQLNRDKKRAVFAKRKALTMDLMQRAVVESLPMVGPTLATNLLAHFGSLQNVLSASEEELSKVPKLGPKKAKIIRNLLCA